MRIWLVALVLIAAFKRTAAALAWCPPVLSPQSGSVPVRGSLYFGDVMKLENVEIRWSGTPGTSTWTRQAGVARLDYTGPHGSELIVFHAGVAGRYKLDEGWRAPHAAPRANGFEYHDERTSFASDALVIDLDQPTAAVRVRWTHAGTTETWLLPTDGRVTLGRLVCSRSNISADELRVGGLLELVAIRLDGSEHTILGVPRFVSSDMYNRVPTAFALVHGVVARVLGAGRRSDRGGSWLPVVLLLCPFVYLSRRISG